MLQKKIDLKLARSVYGALCSVLDGYKFSYQKKEDDLRIIFKIKGESISTEMTVKVHANRRLVLLLSRIPVEVPENRRSAMAIAISQANYNIFDGDFDYSYKNGEIIFRMTLGYCGVNIGEKAIDYLFSCAFRTIDAWAVMFDTVAKNDMSLKEITEYISKKVKS